MSEVNTADFWNKTLLTKQTKHTNTYQPLLIAIIRLIPRL